MLPANPPPPTSTRSLAALFVLYRWFWNQIFTWVGVRRIIDAKCSRSGALRYRCCLNRRSNSYVWAFEKSTRRFRFLQFSPPDPPSCRCASLSSSPPLSPRSSSYSWSSASNSLHDCWSWLQLSCCDDGNDRSEIVGLVESGCGWLTATTKNYLTSKTNWIF